MAQFPTSIPSFNSVSSSETLANMGSGTGHASMTNSENGEIVALATKIGTGSSTPVANRVLRGTGSGISSWAQTDLTTDVTGVLPVANGGLGQGSLAGVPLVSPAITGTVTGGATYSSPTLSTPIIADFSSATHTHANAAGGGQLNGHNAISGGTLTSTEMNSTVAQVVDAGPYKIASGQVAVNANPTTVNFSPGFSATPIVVASTSSAGSANVFTIILNRSSTQFTLRQVNDGGSVTTSESATWIAIGT